jgi:hypothetical protein
MNSISSGSGHENPAVYEMSRWDPSGRAIITATGPTAVDALTAALSGLLVAIRPHAVAPVGSGQSAPIRAEAHDLTALLPALLAALVDQVESFGQDIAMVEVDGLVRSDEGYIAWGTAELSHTYTGPPRPIGFLTPPSVVEELGGATITATIQRENQDR